MVSLSFNVKIYQPIHIICRISAQYYFFFSFINFGCMLERLVSVTSVSSSFAAYITVKGRDLFIVLMGRETSVMRMYVC
jgi:hypothetical protein